MKIKKGMVFHRGRFTYIVMSWNGETQQWNCYSPDAQVTQRFSERMILNFMG